MGLAQIQHVLAQLATDASLRERFCADPQHCGESLGLSPAEAQQLAQLSISQLRFFAASLHHKRFQAVRTALPLTHQVLGKRLAELFRDYTNTTRAQGRGQHRQDVLALARFLVRLGREEPFDPPWLLDLVRYEAACWRLHTPTCWGLLRWFRYPMLTLVRSLAQGTVPPHVRVATSAILWWRWPWQAQPRRLVIGWPRAEPAGSR